MLKKISIIIFSIFILLSCSETNKKADKPEILIYCGITMVKPISEIADIIEKQENCNIYIIKGGSGNLYKSIEMNRTGDIYLPGSESYIEKGILEGHIKDTVFVGINKAAVMVQKGNPKNIRDIAQALINEKYRVVIGNPYSGSIGKETKKTLTKQGIFDAVNKNVSYYTTDSKGLSMALKEDNADITVNWYATSVWEENISYIDVIVADKDFFQEKRLLLSVLKYTKEKEIADKFLKYASSEEGQKIFTKYGLL